MRCTVPTSSSSTGSCSKPSTCASPTNVLLEARNGDTELAFTQADFEAAEHVADGFYRLANGHLLRFLTSATIH